MRPTVSIIIPVYNANTTIARALDSVINQTWENKEIIIIDGGSHDGTVSTIEKYKNQLTYFISEKDNGIYDAINKGIEKSHGEWIYILGADDRFADSRVLENIFTSSPNSFDIIIGLITNENRQNALVPSVHKSHFDSMLRWKNTVHQQGAFYAKHLFEHFRFNIKFKVLADYDFHLLLYSQMAKHLSVPQFIAICDASGTSKNFHWALYSEELRLKKHRLSKWAWLCNFPIVLIKYAFKNISSLFSKMG